MIEQVFDYELAGKFFYFKFGDKELLFKYEEHNYKINFVIRSEKYQWLLKYYTENRNNLQSMLVDLFKNGKLKIDSKMFTPC